MNVSPTPIQREDNLELRLLIRGILRDEFGYEGAGYASGDASLDDMFETYSKEKHAYFILKKDGKLCGGAGFAPLKGGDSKICELQKMYLHPEVRGCGFGSKLIEQCLNHAKNEGYKACYLETTTQMTNAQALYMKFNFQQCEKLGDTGHHGCDLYYMLDLKS